MANYSALIAAINAAIKSNNKREITGPVLNAVLQATVSAFAQGYQFKGMATPSGTPEASDGKVFYIASTAGTYTNYGGAVVAADEVALLYLNGTWSKETLVNLAGFYKKPASGIPSTDMTAAVRASLAKADKAPQIRETYEEDLSDDESKYDDIWDLEVGASRDVTDTTWLNADVAIYHRDFDKFTVNRLSIGFEDDNSHRIYEFVENWGNPSRYYHWMDDGDYYTITRLPDLESTGNKVTSLSSVSTNAQYPSAKCVYDGLATKQPTISDLATIRSGAALGATALQKQTDGSDTRLYSHEGATQGYMGVAGSINNSTRWLVPYVDAVLNYHDGSKADKHSGATSIDSPLVDLKQYLLGDQSSLALTLPASGTYQSYIWVVFKATAAFTPTISGTYVGDTPAATVSGTTYEYLFTWNGSAWVLSILSY